VTDYLLLFESQRFCVAISESRIDDIKPPEPKTPIPIDIHCVVYGIRFDVIAETESRLTSMSSFVRIHSRLLSLKTGVYLFSSSALMFEEPEGTAVTDVIGIVSLLVDTTAGAEVAAAADGEGGREESLMIIGADLFTVKEFRSKSPTAVNSLLVRLVRSSESFQTFDSDSATIHQEHHGYLLDLDNLNRVWHCSRCDNLIDRLLLERLHHLLSCFFGVQLNCVKNTRDLSNSSSYSVCTSKMRRLRSFEVAS